MLCLIERKFPLIGAKRQRLLSARILALQLFPAAFKVLAEPFAEGGSRGTIGRQLLRSLKLADGREAEDRDRYTKLRHLLQDKPRFHAEQLSDRAWAFAVNHKMHVARCPGQFAARQEVLLFVSLEPEKVLAGGVRKVRRVGKP